MGACPNVTQGGMFGRKTGHMVSIGDFAELAVKEDAFCTTASKVRILKMGYVGPSTTTRLEAPAPPRTSETAISPPE